MEEDILANAPWVVGLFCFGVIVLVGAFLSYIQRNYRRSNYIQYPFNGKNWPHK